MTPLFRQGRGLDFPLTREVEVMRFSTTVKNRHGDLEKGFFPPKTIKVFGWYEPKAEIQQDDDFSGRVNADLILYAPTNSMSYEDTVMVDGVKYVVTGVTSYEGSPWSTPNLEVFDLNKVSG